MSQRMLLILDNDTLRRFNDLAIKVQEHSAKHPGKVTPTRLPGRPRQPRVFDPMGRDWIDTGYFKEIDKGIQDFAHHSKCGSKDELNKHMQKSYQDYVNSRNRAAQTGGKVTPPSITQCRELVLKTLLDMAAKDLEEELGD